MLLDRPHRAIGQTSAADLPGGFRHVEISHSLGAGREPIESARITLEAVGPGRALTMSP
jgi:uncharacterized protein (UPF0548 family)